MSTNVSKQKREDLLAKIKEIRTFISAAPQDENTGNLLTYLSDLEKDVNGQKYGLVFEEHREEIDEVLSTHTPVLTEDGSLFIDNGGQMNFLIEGDNIASLQLLEKTHKGKIDVIYIDPPYNTGNKDFVYDDTFVDANDTFRHSKWLSFMEKRLAVAKNLLSENGVIFISIDDNEQAPLKELCNSIFSEHDFLGTIIWLKKRKGSFLSKKIISLTEYIHVYSKNAENVRLFGGKPDESESQPIIKRTNKTSRLLFKAYTVQTKLKDGIYQAGVYGEKLNPVTLLNECEVKNGLFVTELLLEAPFTWSQEFLENELKKGGRVVINTKNFQPRVFRKNDDNTFKGFSSIIYGVNINGTNEDAYEELENIFGVKKIFDYSKPTNLIKELLISSTYFNHTATILDFFAGSGTTGHAVMKLNAEDGGSRRFILCTNNENNICRDVTYERIKRVIDKEGYAASLKYFKVDYIPVSERMYYEYADELLCHIRELVELENGINFTGNAEIGIVLTEEELAEFIANGDAFTKCRKLYMGHDLLPDEEQEKILRSRGVEISIIPDYYYRDLQES